MDLKIQEQVTFLPGYKHCSYERKKELVLILDATFSLHRYVFVLTTLRAVL